MNTRAVRGGNGYVLNGTKRYITNAPFADMILVMARTNVEALPKNAHVSAFLVPRDTPGVSIGKPDGKMGQAGSPIARSGERRVGEECVSTVRSRWSAEH